MKPEVITYKHKMDKAPTEKDKENKVGLDGFMKELEKAGWINRKDFTYSYKGYSEPGNHYMKYTGVLFYT